MNANELYCTNYLPFLEKDFPMQKMGVADKYLLRKVVEKNFERFLKYGENARRPAFIVGILKDMENLGYLTRTGIEKEMSFLTIDHVSFRTKLLFPLDGD